MQNAVILTEVKFDNSQFQTFLIFCLIFAKNMDRGYTLAPPYRGIYNEYPRSMF